YGRRRIQEGKSETTYPPTPRTGLLRGGDPTRRCQGRLHTRARTTILRPEIRPQQTKPAASNIRGGGRKMAARPLSHAPQPRRIASKEWPPKTKANPKPSYAATSTMKPLSGRLPMRNVSSLPVVRTARTPAAKCPRQYDCI